MPCAERVASPEEGVEAVGGGCREDEEAWQKSIRRHPSVRECVLRARKVSAADAGEDDKESDRESGGGQEAEAAGCHGKDVTFGFSVCCAPQHPFPWVSAVASGGSAEEAGLQRGDCLLTVGRTPLVGLPVQCVARTIREAAASSECIAAAAVEVSYWRPMEETGCKEEGTPQTCSQGVCSLEPTLAVTMERLLRTVSELVASVTCPVCLEKPIPKPAIQCTNGHLLCLQCRRRSAKCPVCRVPLRTSSGAPLGGRCLLADQIQAVLNSFGAGEVVQANRASRGEGNGDGETEGSSPGNRPSGVTSRNGPAAPGVAGLKSRVVGSGGTGGAKALIRSFVSWLLASRRERPYAAAQEPLEEGDIYRLCAAM
ncbi:uncharacterized protein LOC124163664 [Ischnura elegans]|uniref:uncharacterized protein LOC124163664 n=1 Tax=Ischnura elegans TaxID=197161 RepID=UPI001ED8A3FB|nr:uncharacterized protein LOC124163664 [Ischnura elegans]